MKLIIYTLIVVLSIGVYFVNSLYNKQLLINHNLQQNIKILQDELSKCNIVNKKYKAKIESLQTENKNSKNCLTKEKSMLIKEIKQCYKKYNNLLVKQAQYKEHNKTVKIILPKTKIDYSKIIPKVDYCNIDLEKGKIKQDDSSNIKLIPNITFDKDKKIDSVNLKIETKF